MISNEKLAPNQNLFFNYFPKFYNKIEIVKRKAKYPFELCKEFNVFLFL